MTASHDQSKPAYTAGWVTYQGGAQPVRPIGYGDSLIAALRDAERRLGPPPAPGSTLTRPETAQALASARYILDGADR